MPSTESEYALEGNAAHKLLEKCSRVGELPKKFLGTDIVVKGDDGKDHLFVVDRPMVDAVQGFLDYTNEFDSDIDIIEERVSYEAWVPNGWGTLDLGQISIAKKRCVITDFKYGMGVKVLAEGNTQLMCYGLGVFQDYGHLYEIDEFQFNIYQPRINHVDEWVVPVAGVLYWAEKALKPAALETANPKAPFAAGKWCQFCAAKATCKTRAQWVFDQTKGDFENLDTGALPLVEVMNDDDIGKLLDNGVTELIKKWCKDIEDYGFSRLQGGHVVGTQKLVEGRSARKWRDEAAAETALRKLRLKVDQIFTRKLITAPAAEKLLGKTHPLLAEHVVKPSGAPVMVPGSDPRPVLTVDVNAEFEDLGAEKESWE